MKKSIRTIIVVGVMLVGGYSLGNMTANQTVDAETKLESKETVQSDVSYPERRIMHGNYYDYMVIETVDGNEWLLDDTEDSQYIESGTAVFEDGELVQVVFDTKGTETVTDDEIMEIRNMDWINK
jgi:hypothetical protein